MHRTALNDIALLLLRLVLGATMFAHGWQKLTGPGFGGVDEMFAGMDVPMSAIAGPFTLLVELVGGALMILGLGTRIVGGLFAFVMLGAIAIVHGSKGFYAADGGFEFALILAATAAALAIAGPGRYAIDALFGRRGAHAAERA